ncbi:MAG: hypothetical protein ACFB4I_01755 [Cyanophyceae cyanobacterium]
MPTLRVTTLADQNDGGASGGLSLRDAILTANTDRNNNYTIQLQGGRTYTLTLNGPEEDAAATGDLDILGNITIRASGQPATITAQGLGDRVFDVLRNRLSLNNVVVTGGSADALSAPAPGGGIRANSDTQLNLTNSTVRDNIAGGVRRHF